MFIQQDPSIEARRRLAMAMMQDGQSPIQGGSGLEALARVLQSTLGAYSMKSADRDNKQGEAAAIEQILSARKASQDPGLQQPNPGGPEAVGPMPAPSTDQRRQMFVDELSKNPRLAPMAGKMALMEAMKEPAGPTVSKPGDVARNPDGSIAWQNPEAVDKPKPRAVGDTREVRRGGNVVTEEWDGSKYVKIGEGAAFAPERERQPNNVQTVTTDEGIFVLNPDGSRGNRIGNAPRSAQPLTAVQQKELFEAEDAVNAGNMAALSIGRALKLNDSAASGWGAGIEQGVNKMFDKQAAADTTSFKTEVLGQALGQLRTIFGGNPTEGERQILLEMEAAPNMTREERKALLTRAQGVVAQRVSFNQRRVDSINSTAKQRGQSPLDESGAAAGASPEADGIPEDILTEFPDAQMDEVGPFVMRDGKKMRIEEGP